MKHRTAPVKNPRGLTTDSAEQKEGSGTSETRGTLIRKVGVPAGGKKEKQLKRLIRRHEESRQPCDRGPGGEEKRAEHFLRKQWLKMPLTWGIKDIRFQEAQRVPHKKNPKKPAPRHITKLPKVKGKARLSKAARQTQLVINKGPSPRPWADFSTEAPGQDGSAQNGPSAQTRPPAENARQTVLLKSPLDWPSRKILKKWL